MLRLYYFISKILLVSPSTVALEVRIEVCNIEWEWEVLMTTYLEIRILDSYLSICRSLTVYSVLRLTLCKECIVHCRNFCMDTRLVEYLVKIYLVKFL